jgi:acetate kinase
MAKELARNDRSMLALNSGWSSLKFGIYRPGATDEQPAADWDRRWNWARQWILTHSFLGWKTTPAT